MEMVPDQGRQRTGAGGSQAALASASAQKPEKKGRKQEGGARKKQVKLVRDQEEEDIISQLSQLHLVADRVVQGTALCYDDRLTEPRCSWDSEFPEKPETVTTVMEKIQEKQLLERCQIIQGRLATKEEIMLVHSADYVEQIRSTQDMNPEQLRSLAGTFDRVFLHEMIYPSCCLAVGCVLQVLDQVMEGQVRNGFAVVRPPGHNALSDAANGYCIFNNLAIAAVYAKKHHTVERVLIVDWGVHHGQGTQYIFEDDPSVLYFSTHRYEHGDFWPHLADSDCTAVGSGSGNGYNVNVPWNKTRMSDADYIAAFHNILMPIAHEFRPNLILVAAGFSSVVGDPEGNMAASPACFAHLTHMLLPLASGKVILSLEGGFNPRATAEAACACLKVLLGDPCPQLELPLVPRQSALESISAVIAVHRTYWKSLQNRETGIMRDEPPHHMHHHSLSGLEGMLQLLTQEMVQSLPSHRTGLVYDESMKEHYNMWDSDHPEQPERISHIYARHQELHLVERCQPVPSQLATNAELQLCHGPDYISSLKATAELKPRDLRRRSSEYNSVYLCGRSYHSAMLAAGSTCALVGAMLEGKVLNGVAIVRPPGHHAEKDLACGFCLFNNVALAARYAQREAGRSIRVLIVDWDVHHGNGTQHMFEEDPSILYVSLHRYDGGRFFPNSEDACHEMAGQAAGEGYNVNVPWNGPRMGDPEYLAAFHTIVMPIAYQFQPELVLVSAGFDAARGDPLGGYQVTPECYAHMTHMLQALAGGRVLIVLEGGYNLTSIAESMAMCTRTLLGDCPPDLGPLSPLLPSAPETINNVIRVQRKYWACLRLMIPDLEPQSQSTSIRKQSLWGQQQLHVPNLESQNQSTSTRKQSLRGQQQSHASSVAETPSHSSTRRGSIWAQSETSFQVYGEASSGHILTTEAQQESSTQLSSTTGSIRSGKLSMENLVQVPRLDTDVQPFPEHRFSLWQNEDVSHHEESDWRLDTGTPSPSSRQRVQGAARADVQKHSITVHSPQRESLVQDLRGSDLSTSSSSRELSDSDQESVRGFTRCALPDLMISEPGTVFAVEPLTSCPHLQAVEPVPETGLDIWEACDECQAEGENWVCLSCYKVYCGRYVNAHMHNHWQVTGHPLVLSYADLSSWCYHCDAYIHHQVLLPVKEEAHRLKFGHGPAAE